MRAIQLEKPGGHERLRLVTLPDPEPGPSEVVVETEAIGVNYADIAVRMGLYESARKLVGFPMVPGFEFSGRVAKLGSDVTEFKVGDPVLGGTFFGGYASAVCVPKWQLFKLPEKLSMVQGATFPTVFFTAWYALCQLGQISQEKSVLVHSAAGGVGLAALQISKAVGARVIGVVGAAHKVEQARKFGADAVIDRSQGKLWLEAERFSPKGYDLVLDASGVGTLRQSYQHLAPTGRLIIYGAHSMLPRGADRPNWFKLAADFVRMPRFDPLRLTNENRGVLGFNLSYLFHHVELMSEAATALFGWLDQGKIRPLPVTQFDMTDVAKAHAALESGNTVGKLVLLVSK